MTGGVVKWFNDASGYGFITPDVGGGDLYVRRSEIASADSRMPVAGDRVEYESRVGGMGPEAVGVVLAEG